MNLDVNTSNRLPRVELTKHAVDRMSERCLDVWVKHCETEGKIGIMSFLHIKSREAYSLLLRSVKDQPISVCTCKVIYAGMIFLFSNEEGITRLLTVYTFHN